MVIPASWHNTSSIILSFLYRNCRIKHTDKNLVYLQKDTVFSARQEISSSDFKVMINIAYICRNCLNLQKKRSALLSNLENVITKQCNAVKSSSSNFILTVSLLATPESSCPKGELKSSLKSELPGRISDLQISDTLVTC